MRQKAAKLARILVLALCAALVFAACSESSILGRMLSEGESAKPQPTLVSTATEPPEEEEAEPEPEPTVYGTLSQIEGEAERPAGWEQIVQSSEFQLGGMTYDPHLDLYQVGYGTYPVMDGSAISRAMGVEFARQYLKLSEETIEKMTAHWAEDNQYEQLISQTISEDAQNITLHEDPQVTLSAEAVQLVIGTMPSGWEFQAAGSAGVQLMGEPVCRDGFVFVTHPSSPVSELTVQQVRSIYAQGTATWNVEADSGEVIYDMTIVPYQREEGAGSRAAMEEEVMGGYSAAEPSAAESAASADEMMRGVLSHNGGSSMALGYTYGYYLENLYEGEDVKVLRINGVAPTRENIENGTYPLVVNYYGIIRSEDLNETPGKFLKWMMSEEGQACIEQAGYIPLN